MLNVTRLFSLTFQLSPWLICEIRRCRCGVAELWEVTTLRLCASAFRLFGVPQPEVGSFYNFSNYPTRLETSGMEIHRLLPAVSCSPNTEDHRISPPPPATHLTDVHTASTCMAIPEYQQNKKFASCDCLFIMSLRELCCVSTAYDACAYEPKASPSPFKC